MRTDELEAHRKAKLEAAIVMEREAIRRLMNARELADCQLQEARRRLKKMKDNLKG